MDIYDFKFLLYFLFWENEERVRKFQNVGKQFDEVILFLFELVLLRREQKLFFKGFTIIFINLVYVGKSMNLNVNSVIL